MLSGQGHNKEHDGQAIVHVVVDDVVTYSTAENPLCKIFQNQEHGLVGLLTRPITGDQAHYDTGQDEEKNYEDPGLHMINVPCIRPNTSAMAIALRNMPVMIHTMSII